MRVTNSLELVITRAQHIAALTESFAPSELVEHASGPDGLGLLDKARVIAMIQEDSVPVDPARQRWQLRSAKRRKILSAPSFRDDANALLTATLLDGSDDIVAALNGEGAFAPAIVQRSLARTDDPDSSDLATLRRQQIVLDQVGPAAPAFVHLPTITSRLDLAERIDQTNAILQKGFYGRGEERREIADWIAHPTLEGPLRCVYISGLPGVGKSFLLEKCVQEAWGTTTKPIILRLDFDRRSLNPYSGNAIAIELAMQLADEVPQAAVKLKQARDELRADFGARKVESRGISLPPSLAKIIGAVVEDSGRPVLVVLDTMEVLRGYGETHPPDLFRFLDELLQYGIGPMAVIAAGRNDVAVLLDHSHQQRVARHIELLGLEDRAARAFLREKDCRENAIEDILAATKGNPLLMRMAVEAYARDPNVLNEMPDGQPQGLVSAYLYRAILSRIDDELLKKVAHPGLILAQISAKVIAEAIGPAIGEEIDQAQAERVFDELRTHHWLVQDSGLAGWVTHVPDVRKQILPMLYNDRPAMARRVNEEAAAWFERHDDKELAAYHRLQLSRDGSEPRLPDFETAIRIRSDLVEELPPEAQIALRQLRGERSEVARATEALSVADEVQVELIRAVNLEDLQPAANAPRAISAAAVQELMLTLNRGDLGEARLIYDHESFASCAPNSPAADARLCYWWLTGQWSRARAVSGWRGFLPPEEARSKTDDLRHLVLLEMRAEFEFDALARSLQRRHGVSDTVLRRVQGIYASAREARLNEGPIAFALLCDDRSTSISGGFQDAVGSAGLGLQDDGHALEYGLRDAEAIRRHFGLDAGVLGGAPSTGCLVPEDLGPDIQKAEELSRLSPYAISISALVLNSKSAVLKGALTTLSTRLEHLPGFQGDRAWLLEWSKRGQSGSRALVDLLNALGMTSDWTGALTFFRPLRHLASLARSAERWRRTTAGDWQFGSTTPYNWKNRPGPVRDLGMLDRIERLLQTASPIDVALAELRFWASLGRRQDSSIAVKDVARLVAKARAAWNRASQAGPPEAFVLGFAHALQDARVPRAIAAPLSVAIMALRDRQSRDFDEVSNEFAEALRSADTRKL